MREKAIRYVLMYFLLIVLLMYFILMIPFQPALVFYKENTNDIEAYLPVSIGDTFFIVFTHSIHLTDVIEKYKITENYRIKQYEMIFEEFGIGMPSTTEEDEYLTYEDGKYHLKNMKQIFTAIHVRNGKTVSKHKLIWGEKEEHIATFNTYFKPGAWFTLKVDRLSIWQLMKGERIHG